MPTLPDLKLGLQQVNIGQAADDGQGDDLRTAFSKLNYDLGILSSAVQEPLLTNRNYYVSPTGSNTNNGLTSSTAFQTIAYALGYIQQQLRLNQYQVVLNLAPGTYAESVSVNNLLGAGSLGLTIQRDPTSSGIVYWYLDTALNGTGNLSCLSVTNASVFVNGIVFRANTANPFLAGMSLLSVTNGTLRVGSVEFGPVGVANVTLSSHIHANNATVVLASAYNITGDAHAHILAENGSQVISVTAANDPKVCQLGVITNSVLTPVNFTYFLKATNRSSFNLPDSLIRYVGSTTGAQFYSDVFSSLSFGLSTLPSGLTIGSYQNFEPSNAVNFRGSATFLAGLNVQSAATFGGATEVDGHLKVTGTSEFNNSVIFGGSVTLPALDPTTNDQTAATTAFVQQVVQTKIISATPIATDALYGLIKTDVALSDPVVYTQPSVDALLATKASLASPLFTGQPKAPTPNPGTNTTQVATTEFVQAALAAKASVPTGCILIFGGAYSSIPTGYLPCDGSSYSRTDYSALFGVINTIWGAADSTTFKVPNLQDAMPFGASGTGSLGTAGGSATVTLTTANLPAHSHTVVDAGHTHSVRDTGHTHNVYDPGHLHGLNDPGHSHTNYGLPVEQTRGGEAFQWVTSPGGLCIRGQSATLPASTGIYMDRAATGISIYGSGTGITNNVSGTGITLQSTGSSTAVNVLNPHKRVNYIIKA